MKKRYLFLTSAILITSIMTGCHNPSTARTSQNITDTQPMPKDSLCNEDISKNNSELNITTDISKLTAQPAYGANPDYEIWTTLPYLVEDAQMQFTATISADEELKHFEIQCYFFEDQVATVENSDGSLSVIDDKTGFMSDIAKDIVQYAINQNIWLSTQNSSEQYGVFNDPKDEPIAVNYVADNRPLYIQANVWDENFERKNTTLNNVTTEIKDELLEAYKQPCDIQGTVTAIEYETYYYAKDMENGDALSYTTPITKTAYVYLPAQYDATQEYNILYLLHGGGDYAAKWFSQQDEKNGEEGKGYAVNILDNIFANENAEPFIVVTPGLYNDNDTKSQELTGYTETYAYELHDLMKAVESKYSTYAKDTTDESFIESRDHRAFAGLSMGSITTWHSIIPNCIDIVSWFGMMSAGPSSDVTEAANYTKEIIIPAIENAADNGYKINMLLNMNGVHDIALEPHVQTHKILVDFSQKNNALTIGENYDFIVSDGAHTFEAWNLYLYDMAQIFFK